VSNAVFISKLTTLAFPVAVDGDQYLEARAETLGREPVDLILRAKAGAASGPTSFLMDKKPGDTFLITGELTLVNDRESPDRGTPVVRVFTISKATEDQYANEVNIVGRVVQETKNAEKSSSRSVAVNRYLGKAPNGQSIVDTDWFRVRGYGKNGERLASFTKGTLVEIDGMLEKKQNKAGKPYCEVKIRRVRSHKAGKGGEVNPAADKEAAGYESSAFDGKDEPDFPTNW
tara:strand:+ start:76 stop:768 length:693 start_codon:yes stop_codon:yes gene_type:complete